MFKVLVWDYVGTSKGWFKKAADMKDIEVVGTLTPDTPEETAAEILLKRDTWDWILIFEKGARKFFDATIQMLGLPPDRVVYALDLMSWLQHTKAAFALINPEGAGAFILRSLHFSVSRQIKRFVTCTVEGVSYISPSTDPLRMPRMYIDRVNWAARDMKRFHELAQEYYGVNDSAGYFFDLGANIGTTGIYFVKNIAPKLKLLAFEPDAENFKMHRVNLILNDLGDDKATLVNCGLGSEFGELMLYNNGKNPGARGFIRHEKSTPISAVKIIPLDAYLAEKNIAARDVKYIWIDTEGFEAQVLLGAKNLLAENPAPIFVEFNLGAWRKSDRFAEFFALLAKGYSHFINFDRGKETLYPIDALRTLTPPNRGLGRIGSDIFLIKANAERQ